MRYVHLYGLIPKLGLYSRETIGVPFDFDEIVASVIPRPVIVLVPKWDKDNALNEVEACLKKAAEFSGTSGGGLTVFKPDDHHRFSNESRERVIEWLLSR